MLQHPLDCAGGASLATTLILNLYTKDLFRLVADVRNRIASLVSTLGVHSRQSELEGACLLVGAIQTGLSGHTALVHTQHHITDDGAVGAVVAGTITLCSAQFATLCPPFGSFMSP